MSLRSCGSIINKETTLVVKCKTRVEHMKKGSTVFNSNQELGFALFSAF